MSTTTLSKASSTCLFPLLVVLCTFPATGDRLQQEIGIEESPVVFLQAELLQTSETGIASGVFEPLVQAKMPLAVPEDGGWLAFGGPFGRALDLLLVAIFAVVLKHFGQHSGDKAKAKSGGGGSPCGKNPLVVPPVPLVKPLAPVCHSLTEAVQAGDYAGCESLLVRGVDLHSTDAWDCTVLHAAAAGGSVAIARLLVDRGAVLDAIDAWDETPLHFAARAGHANMCEFLLARGAAMDSMNAQDWTPLLVAAHSNKEVACRVLVDKGAGTGGASDCDVPPLLQSLLFERILQGGGKVEPQQDLPREKSQQEWDADDEKSPICR